MEMSLKSGAEEGNEASSPTPTPIKVDEDAVETGDGTLTQDIFSNLIIREEILKNLHVPDLLKASLVCKEWKRFCRDTLREKRRCLAKIGRKEAWHDLKELSSLLETSDCIPFNGMSVDLHPTLVHVCYSIAPEAVLKIGTKILAVVDIKYFTIRVDGLLQHFSGFLKNKCGNLDPVRAVSLQELRFLGSDTIRWENFCLEFLGISRWGNDFLGIYDHKFLLPNVRCLEFPSTSYRPEVFRFGDCFWLERVVDILISVSPKLEEIRGKIVPENLEFLLTKGVAQLVKEFHFRPAAHLLGTVYQFALTNPKLHQLKFSSYGNEREQGLEVFKLLLQSSKKSLRLLAIENVDLGFMLFQWTDIPVFENVEQLRLGFDPFLNLPYDSTVPLRKLEWFKYFPNLKQVCIDYANWWSEDGAEFDLEFWEGLLGLPGEYCCNTVTKVIFTQNRFEWVHPIEFDRFKNVFPNIKSCLIEQNSSEKTMHLSDLWSAWPDLEEICIFGITSSCDNYDDEFKGISEEEAKTLKENFGEAFESLELVPVQPNILSFQMLKKLAVQVNHGYPQVSYSGTAFLSSNVCRWMHSRIHGLVFEIDTHCRRIGQDRNNCGSNTCFEHLLPFAKLARQNFQPYF